LHYVERRPFEPAADSSRTKEPVTVRVAQFSVQKLFGLFDHDIKFKLQDRITIIHAPNGYGKTVILKLLNGLFGGSLSIFREVEYEKIVVRFDDHSRLIVTQEPADNAAAERGQYIYIR
jgi:predicted ATP-binding protein involved in virulence